jgi:hypothetical protein
MNEVAPISLPVSSPKPANGIWSSSGLNIDTETCRPSSALVYNAQTLCLATQHIVRVSEVGIVTSCGLGTEFVSR